MASSGLWEAVIGVRSHWPPATYGAASTVLIGNSARTRLRGQGVSGLQLHRIADCYGLWGALEQSRAAVQMTSGIPTTVAIGIPIWHQRCGRPDRRTPPSNSMVNCGYSPDLTATISTTSGRSN